MSRLGSLYIKMGEPEGEMPGCCDLSEWAAGVIEDMQASQAQAAVEPNSWEALYWAQVKLKEAAVKKMHKVNDLLLGKQAKAAVEPVGHVYTINGLQHCTIEKQLEDCALYTSPPDHTKAMRLALEILREDQKYDRTSGKVWKDKRADAIAALEGSLE